MHPFLIDINDLFSLLGLNTPCSRPSQKEFVFYSNDNYKLASALGHFKFTWYFIHFFFVLSGIEEFYHAAKTCCNHPPQTL